MDTPGDLTVSLLARNLMHSTHDDDFSTCALALNDIANVYPKHVSRRILAGVRNGSASTFISAYTARLEPVHSPRAVGANWLLMTLLANTRDSSDPKDAEIARGILRHQPLLNYFCGVVGAPERANMSSNPQFDPKQLVWPALMFLETCVRHFPGQDLRECMPIYKRLVRAGIFDALERALLETGTRIDEEQRLSLFPLPVLCAVRPQPLTSSHNFI